MPQIKAVVFDMDGLMFNTEDLYDIVSQSLLERRGKQFTNDLKLKMMGLPGPKAFQVMKTECDLDDSIEALESELHADFFRLLPQHIQMMPGLSALLGLLENLSIPKGVATSSERELAHQALGTFDLVPRFEFVLTSNDVTHGKPHPEIYETAAHRFNIQPNQMLALEDSVIGSTAAAAAGAFTIAVPGSHSVNGDFDHVDYVVDSLESQTVLGLFAKI